MPKQPNSRRNLDMAIHRLATSDKEFVKLRAMLANAIVGQMLPDGAVKGGTALKFRFGDKATRFTTDLDAARQSDLEVFVERLETSLAVGWNGFEGRLVPREQARPAHVSPQYVMRPFDIKMDYRGKPWCTVTLEVGHNELGDADEPERVPPLTSHSCFTSSASQSLTPCLLCRFTIKSPRNCMERANRGANGRTTSSTSKLSCKERQSTWP